MSITFGYPFLLVPLVGIVCLGAWWRWYKHRGVFYRFSSIAPFIAFSGSYMRYKVVPFLLRCATLILIACALVRPRVPDENSRRIDVQGIDIMMVLDVSGSMQQPDSYGQSFSKFQIARREAISFIQKRINDQIGIILFAYGTLVRAPLTFDKQIVTDILGQTEIGVLLNPNHTHLGAALLAALNKLKDSHAKSKIVIMLTDGNPSDDPRILESALELAKKLGVKIYTIGIGAEAPSANHARMFGDVYLNVKLLKRISDDTGGQFFLAQHADELETIYAAIDQLEKTEYQKPDYAHYLELWPWLLAGALLFFLCELLLTQLWWVSL